MGHIDTGGAKGKGLSQDFELNMASIIDCLTVLLTFLLASSSFLAIGILDAGVAAQTASTAKQEVPDIQVSLHLSAKHNLELKVSGKIQQTLSVPAKNDAWDTEKVLTRLKDLKQSYPKLQGLMLSADDSVEYKDVVMQMDQIRPIIPAMMLGGF